MSRTRWAFIAGCSLGTWVMPTALRTLLSRRSRPRDRVVSHPRTNHNGRRDVTIDRKDALVTMDALKSDCAIVAKTNTEAMMDLVESAFLAGLKLGSESVGSSSPTEGDTKT